MVRGVKRIIRSTRSKTRKAKERKCRYLVVGNDGEDYAAASRAEAVQIATQVGGSVYMNCSGHRTLIEE